MQGAVDVDERERHDGDAGEAEEALGGCPADDGREPAQAEQPGGGPEREDGHDGPRLHGRPRGQGEHLDGLREATGQEERPRAEERGGPVRVGAPDLVEAQGRGEARRQGEPGAGEARGHGGQAQPHDAHHDGDHDHEDGDDARAERDGGPEGAGGGAEHREPDEAPDAEGEVRPEPEARGEIRVLGGEGRRRREHEASDEGHARGQAGGEPEEEDDDEPPGAPGRGSGEVGQAERGGEDCEDHDADDADRHVPPDASIPGQPGPVRRSDVVPRGAHRRSEVTAAQRPVAVDHGEGPGARCGRRAHAFDRGQGARHAPLAGAARHARDGQLDRRHGIAPGRAAVAAVKKAWDERTSRRDTTLGTRVADTGDDPDVAGQLGEEIGPAARAGVVDGR